MPSVFGSHSVGRALALARAHAHAISVACEWFLPGHVCQGASMASRSRSRPRDMLQARHARPAPKAIGTLGPGGGGVPPSALGPIGACVWVPASFPWAAACSAAEGSDPQGTFLRTALWCLYRKSHGKWSGRRAANSTRPICGALQSGKWKTRTFRLIVRERWPASCQPLEINWARSKHQNPE